MCGPSGTCSGHYAPTSGVEENAPPGYEAGDFFNPQAHGQHDGGAHSHTHQYREVPEIPEGLSTSTHHHGHHRAQELYYLNRPAYDRAFQHQQNVLAPPPPPMAWAYPGVMYFTPLGDGTCGASFVPGPHCFAVAAGNELNQGRPFYPHPLQDQAVPSSAPHSVYTQAHAPTGQVPQQYHQNQAHTTGQRTPRNPAASPVVNTGAWGSRRDSRYEMSTVAPDTPVMAAAELRTSRSEREYMRGQRREQRRARRSFRPDPIQRHRSWSGRNPGDGWDAWNVWNNQ